MRGGMLEFLFVFENIAGARHRETHSYPTRNTIDAVRRAAKQLAYRGDVTSVSKLRLRREEFGGELKDDDSLRRMFVNEFAEHYDDEEWG